MQLSAIKLILSYHNRLLIATTLLSVALIAYQVAIIQLLSYVQWYHYANMVISIALLGFGAAGTVLSLLRKRLLDHSGILLPLLMIVSGLTMVMAVWLSRSGFARFDSYLLFIDRSQWLSLFINYLLFFFPFFFGALALGIIFVKHVAEIGKFYFSNLMGSGIGAVMAAGLASYFFPAVLPVVMALMAIASGLILLQRKKRWLIIILAFATVVFAFYRIVEPVDLTISEYKSLSRTLNLPAAKITLKKPGPFGFVEVVSADALRYAPGLSLAFTGEVPVKKEVFNNGDWFGPVVSWNAKDSFHLLDFTTMALPYVLKQRNNVLVLHAGTGLPISHALSRGATNIDAIEPHQTVTNLLLHELAVDNDSLYYHPVVKIHVIEPRTFLSATHKKYDLIQLPIVGAFGGGAGLYAMREEYSLTKEAFLQMWNLLEDDGVISITAWMDYPFRNPLKIAATIAETAEAAGLSPIQSHIIAVRSWGTISFLLKKSPLSSSDTSAIRKFCNKLFFDPVVLSGLSDEERTIYNGMNDESFFAYMDELLSGKRENLYKDYDFYLRPATDDKPYFSQFLRWKSLPHLSNIFGSQLVPFLELGWLISIITFLQLSLLALLLIILPLFKIGWKGSRKLWTLLYFSGLGIGYMFLEIVLIQQFILFFGNPVYAAALVIAAMMLASGAGSYYSSSLRVKRSIMQRILLMIVVLLLLYSFFLSAFLQNITGLSIGLKLGISLIIIAIPSLLMGMPFPMGLRLLSGIEEKNIPWAWGINGCMSVISAALATLLAVEAGFTVVMILAAFAYATCLLAMYGYRLKE
jgi:spermidine synthase